MGREKMPRYVEIGSEYVLSTPHHSWQSETNHNTGNNTWKELPQGSNPPAVRSSHYMVYHNNSLILFGGIGANKYNDMYMYSLGMCFTVVLLLFVCLMPYSGSVDVCAENIL